MVRILIFLLSIVFLAGAITYFASLDSRITGEAFGYRFDGPSGLIVGGLFALFLVAIYLTHTVKNLMALPGKLRAREKEARRERGVAALTRGLEAVAVGDAADASHHAKVARRHLDDIALTRLLTAQAAQLSGDETAARSSFSAMLEAPETEFLGLKGLYHQAVKDGDRDKAREYAERAFRLRPNAPWAFESMLDLGLERGAWRQTREAVAQARRNGVAPQDKADRASAALLTADAYAAATSGERKLALNETEAALKLAPGFAPAALLAARLYAEDGRTGKAAKTIEASFAADAHPALVKFYDGLYKDEENEKRAERLRKLAAKNSDSREAALLEARAHNLMEEWAAAVDKLKPLFAQTALGPTAFSLMAAATAGLYGDEAARPWLERAASAPRDPRPGADGEFLFTREGWARLVREYMDHGRLSPPPLEETAPAMSAEEVRLLTAPPPEPPAEDEAESEEETAPDATPTDELEEPVGAGEAVEETAIQTEDSADGADSAGGQEQEGGEAAARSPADEDDHIHDDEEAERAAAAAGKVS